MLNDEIDRISQMTNDGNGEGNAFQTCEEKELPAEENELKASDLENIAILYDQVRSVRRKNEHNIDKKLAEDFDQHLKRVMYDLSVSL